MAPRQEGVMAVGLGCAIQAWLETGSGFQDCDAACEAFRQHFGQLQDKEAAGPRQAFHRPRELCCRGLKADTHPEGQILELLVLEQFSASCAPRRRAG